MDGFRYASGGHHTASAIPSSAFSKGDLLMRTSASSFSRINPYAIAATARIAGIALCDSTDSIQNQVPMLRVKDDTHFWARVAAGSTLTAGARSGVSFVVATGRYYLDASTGTLVAEVVKGVGEVDQSTESKVLCKLLVNGGLVDGI